MSPQADRLPTSEDALGQLLAATELLHGPRARGTAGRDLDRAHERWRLMREIARDERTIAELARRVRATRAHVQAVADALVLDGLARYEPNSSPRRAQRIALTTDGRRALASVDGSARAWLHATSPAQTTAELESTRRFLLTVIAVAGDEAGVDAPEQRVDAREQPRR